MKTITPAGLRAVAHDYQRAREVSHIPCAQRQRILLDAVMGAACVIEHNRRSRHGIIAIAWACAILWVLSGVGIGALIFAP